MAKIIYRFPRSIDIIGTRLRGSFLIYLRPQLLSRLRKCSIPIEVSIVLRIMRIVLLEGILSTLLQGPIVIHVIFVVQREKDDKERFSRILVAQDVSELM
jgi:hypothetical protein